MWACCHFGDGRVGLKSICIIFYFNPNQCVNKISTERLDKIKTEAQPLPSQHENSKKSFYWFQSSVARLLWSFGLGWGTFFPPSFLSISGASLEENTVLGILQRASAGFPARHERAHVTKDLHICQRFGAEEKRGRPFITLQKKIQAQSWALLAHRHEVLVPVWTRLKSYPSPASLQVRVRIWQMTRRGTRKKILSFTGSKAYVMFGQLYWTGEAMLCLDWIKQFVFFRFFWWLFRLCLSNVAANAPKAFSNILLNSACTGKNLI